MSDSNIRFVNGLKILREKMCFCEILKLFLAFFAI